MKQFLFSIMLTAVALTQTVQVHADNVMTKGADGTYVVNTTTICNAR